jgi:hypothetical protein
MSAILKSKMAAVTIEILMGTKLKVKIYPLTYIHANFDAFVPKCTILYLSRCTTEQSRGYFGFGPGLLNPPPYRDTSCPETTNNTLFSIFNTFS